MLVSVLVCADGSRCRDVVVHEHPHRGVAAHGSESASCRRSELRTLQHHCHGRHLSCRLRFTHMQRRRRQLAQSNWR